jgi:hypothetical protein
MMPYVIVYTASLGVIGASAWMLSAVDDADFEELQDSDIAIAVPDPGMNNPLHYQQQAVLPIV